MTWLYVGFISTVFVSVSLTNLVIYASTSDPVHPSRYFACREYRGHKKAVPGHQTAVKQSFDWWCGLLDTFISLISTHRVRFSIWDALTVNTTESRGWVGAVSVWRCHFVQIRILNKNDTLKCSHRCSFELYPNLTSQTRPEAMQMAVTLIKIYRLQCHHLVCISINTGLKRNSV